jgi:hypothetical protein
LNKLAIISCLLILVSCKAHKLVVANKPADSASGSVAEKKADARLIDLGAHQLVFSTFSAKADTKLSLGSDNNNVTLNIRINHDKEIWVSVTALLGIEVARAVITPDSIKTINKLQAVYLKKPFSYVYSYSNKQINYKMLEAILVGNTIPDVLNDNKVKVAGENATITLSGSLQDLIYQLLFGAEMKTTQLNLNNQNEGQTLQVSYSNFIKINDGLVPSQIEIQSSTPKDKIQASLHYTKVDLNQPLQYPFNIPERYTSADGN